MMEQESARPDLFFAAAILAGIVLLMILAKPLMGVRSRHRPTPWVIGLAMLFPASVGRSEAPRVAAGHYGWSSIHAPLDHVPYTGRNLWQVV